MSHPPTSKSELIERGVTTLFGAYVDIHGVPKSKAVPIDHFDDYVGGSELYTVGASVYQQAGAEAAASDEEGAAAGNSGDGSSNAGDDVIDAEFTETK